MGCAVPALMATAVGCSVITPPPVLPAHEVAQPLAEGTTTVSLVGGVGAGLWIDGGYGLELRVARQVSSDLQLGAGVGLARNTEGAGGTDAEEAAAYRRCLDADRRRGDFPLFGLGCVSPAEKHHPRWLLAARLFGRHTPDPDRDFYAVTFGVGAGIGDGGLGWLTFDGGVRLSNGSGTAAAVTNPTVGLSIPFARGRAIDLGKRPRTTFFWAVNAGLVTYRDDDLGASLDLTFIGLHGLSDGGALLLLTGGVQARDLDGG